MSVTNHETSAIKLCKNKSQSCCRQFPRNKEITEQSFGSRPTASIRIDRDHQKSRDSQLLIPILSTGLKIEYKLTATWLLNDCFLKFLITRK